MKKRTNILSFYYDYWRLVINPPLINEGWYCVRRAVMSGWAEYAKGAVEKKVSWNAEAIPINELDFSEYVRSVNDANVSTNLGTTKRNPSGTISHLV